MMPPRVKNPNKPADNDPGWLHFVESYFGAGAVLFAMDPEGINEVVNDLDITLTTFWRVLADEKRFDEFVRRVEATPCSSREFKAARVRLESPWEYHNDVLAAVDFFIVNRQSRQALGHDFSTLVRNRTRRGMNELASAWLSAVDGLPAVHARLQRVVIECMDAIKLIRREDGPRTLHYLDPPYYPDTRTVLGTYTHEPSQRAHAILLATISNDWSLTFTEFYSLDGTESFDEFQAAVEFKLEGRFILSGYRCAIYDAAAEASGWRRVDVPIDNKAGSGKVKQQRIESIWTNYEPPGVAALRRAAP